MLKVMPDLTSMGKVIDGGLAIINAFGGRQEIMERFSQTKRTFVLPSGTANTPVLTDTAEKAVLEIYNESAMKHLNVLGATLRRGLHEIMNELGVQCFIDGVQSIAYIQFLGFQETKKKELSVNALPSLEFLNYLRMAMAVNGLCAISAYFLCFLLSPTMSEKLVDKTLERFQKSMAMVLPIYEDMKSH